GWTRIALDRDGRTVRFTRPGMALDLGGIGKGYALDRAAATLGALGVRHATLDLGGQLLVMGVGAATRVAVAHPGSRLEPAVELEVGDASVSTSGQSERGFDAGGVRYGHILDPRTGRPVPGAATVTVVCRSATRADALSTALLVMGRVRAEAFARAHAIGALWLEPAGRTVRAWSWNLPGARTAPGAHVQWMDDGTLSKLMLKPGEKR
ncbi:MAG TPA: FAD:protein FMN transferase, partial [Candidatus Eisenbacteria bacterium]|nr:FAD:protein FMN transferase [Candidatus Eisenbacteria bacterium]